MPTCFVIQPFDGDRFDKRYEDTFKPSLTEAGLTPYRVDRDPDADVPIDAIEDGIRNAHVVLSEITTDNPNVWYELGFAFALGKPMIMVCSDERTSPRYPFDIQHRHIIRYRTDSASDYEELREKITRRAEALLNRKDTLRKIAATAAGADPVSPREGLTQGELTVIAVLASETVLPGDTTSVESLKHESESSGLTSFGFGLGFRRLIDKGLAETLDEEDINGVFLAARLTTKGLSWIESNENLFAVTRPRPETQTLDQVGDDDIPF